MLTGANALPRTPANVKGRHSNLGGNKAISEEGPWWATYSFTVITSLTNSQDCRSALLEGEHIINITGRLAILDWRPDTLRLRRQTTTFLLRQ